MFKQLRFKGNCRKVSSENTTKVKEEGNNDDETNEEQNENENEDADSEDNDFVILDFVGKKGKVHVMKHFFFYLKHNMICKKTSYMVTYYDNYRDNQENFRLCIWLQTWYTSFIS